MTEIKEEITLNFNYNQEEERFICHKKEKMKNMFYVFCRIKQIKLESVYFLCNGLKLTIKNKNKLSNN